MRTLIRSGHVAAMDAAGTEYPGGYVVLAGDRIEALGPAVETPPPDGFDRVVEAGGCVVLPGLVNAHQHLWYTLFRGLGSGLELEPWLERLLFPLGRLIEDEDMVLSTRLGCLEMLATGTTTAFYHMVSRTTPPLIQRMAQAAEETGFRLILGKEVRPDPLEGELDDAETVLQTLGDGLVRGGLVIETAGHWVARGATSEELIQGGWELAGKYDARISDHVATGTLSVERGYLKWVRETGRTDIEYLHQLGVLDEHWLLVHAIWLTERDLDLLGAAGANTVHCPTSHAMRGGGITPAYRLHQRGARVVLGSDGPMVDSSVDMLEQAKALLMEQHQIRLDAGAFDARQALAMVTRRAAEALGLEAEIGSLEPGKRADVAVFDLSRPHVGLVHDPLASLVTAAHGSDVRWLFVDGRLRLEEGGLVGQDYAALREQAAGRARDLARQAELM